MCVCVCVCVRVCVHVFECVCVNLEDRVLRGFKGGVLFSF